MIHLIFVNNVDFTYIWVRSVYYLFTSYIMLLAMKRKKLMLYFVHIIIQYKFTIFEKLSEFFQEHDFSKLFVHAYVVYRELKWS